MKKILSVFLSLALCLGLTTNALAVAPWALDGLCEAESLELLTTADMELLEDAVAPEKLAAIAEGVKAKLALLEVPARDHTPTAKAGDVTRGGVLAALYDAAAGFAFEGVEAGAVDYLAGLGVVKGDQNGDYALGRPCTLQETFLFAQRLVLALYDRADAGSRGLLWKAEQGDNVLYLFGSYHVDRGDLYPFHKSVRDMITASEAVCFEIDFGDVEGAQDFYSHYYYPEGDCLKNHLEAADYAAAVEALAAIGWDEATVNSVKAWGVGNALSQLAYMDESTGASQMVTDAYLYSKAVCNGKAVEQVESYGYQGALMDGLSEAVQTAMVREGLAALRGEGEEIADLFTPWQRGDLTGFEGSLKKDAVPATAEERELNDALFTQRDKAMTAWCESFLTQEGAHTAAMVVGAGHMVGQTGVVENLRAAGYTVTPVLEER